MECHLRNRPLIGVTADADAERFKLRRTYCRLIEQAGGVPVILPCVIEVAEAYLARCDGVVLSGGDDPDMRDWGEPTHPKADVIDPDRQRFERRILELLDERPAMPTQRIAQELIARLEQQDAMGRLQGCDFDVQVEKAVVKFSGSVALPQQQQLLLDVAHRVPGVREVSADLQVNSWPMEGVSISPASAQMPVAYSHGDTVVGSMAGIDQTPRPIGAGRMAAYAGGAVLAAPMMAVNHMSGGGVPAHLPGGGHAAVPARYDHPNLPGYAWPSYAAYPNYAAVTYPKQYSPTAWPYIGPFYPYPQVPLGWRKVTLQWKDGWWQLNFNSK